METSGSLESTDLNVKSESTDYDRFLHPTEVNLFLQVTSLLFYHFIFQQIIQLIGKDNSSKP